MELMASVVFTALCAFAAVMLFFVLDAARRAHEADKQAAQHRRERR